MGGLQCLLYMSRATRDMAPAEVDHLLHGARERNRARGVTGALMHYDGRFMQVLEGEAAAVEQCYQRIQSDPRHDQVTRLYHGPIAAPRFLDWSMRYISGEGRPDRAVSAFLDQLYRQPSTESVQQAIALLHRLAAGSAQWPAR